LEKPTEILIDEIKRTFEYIGIKKVTKTDVSKQAYVPDAEQRKVLEKAGIVPGQKDLDNIPRFELHELISGEVFQSSYYMSIREGSGRTPENRMGIFIKNYKEGDELLLATDGEKVFIHNVGPKDKNPQVATHSIKTQKIYRQLSPQYLLKKAQSATKKPERKKVETSTYNRNHAIVVYVQERSGFKCEVDSCNYQGFEKEDGTKFIEVHHLIQLSENGEDSIDNAVAVCPNCHRLLHYGKDRKSLREVLKTKIISKNKIFINHAKK
jgi:5-methylcytosine-specific restriction endonuclease McrA